VSVAQSLAESIVHRYLTLIRYQRYVSDLIRRTTNVSGRQLGVLRHLVQNGSCTVGQISQYLYVRDATTSCLLDRLERDGYVTRRRSAEDNRKVFIDLTDLGRQVVAQAPMGTAALMRARLPECPIEELLALDQALQKLSALADVDESVLD
jgi:MarR family transcriptional regulator, organic hydroperoxide resistance regulator